MSYLKSQIDEKRQDGFITVATFSQIAEAHLFKEILEGEGIQCFIADENIIGMNWLYSNAVGGVKLQVRASDAERALEVLKPEISKIIPPENITSDEVDIICPKCGSADAYYEKFSRRTAFFSWILLGFPLPFLKRKWICNNCGFQW